MSDRLQTAVERAEYLASRRERNKRSYEAKIARGECGHCAEPLSPTSRSCCVLHESYFREKMRRMRGVEESIRLIRNTPIPDSRQVRESVSDKMYRVQLTAILLLPRPFIKKLSFRTDDSCWHWTGNKVCNPRYADNPIGQQYGQYTFKARLASGGWRTKGVAAHKFAYEIIVGPVPKGRELDHLCENKLCVNPAHLEPVTHQENVLRGFMRREGYAA